MKRLLIAVVFLISVTTGLVLTPSSAFALPCCDNFYTFFSDCTYTAVIGESVADCNGHVQQWGTVNWQGPRYYQATSCGNDSCGDPPICVASGYYCP